MEIKYVTEKVFVEKGRVEEFVMPEYYFTSEELASEDKMIEIFTENQMPESYNAYVFYLQNKMQKKIEILNAKEIISYYQAKVKKEKIKDTINCHNKMIALVKEDNTDKIVISSLKKDTRLSDSFKHDKGNITSVNFLNDEYYILHRFEWVPDDRYGGETRKLSYTLARNGGELLTFDEEQFSSSLFTLQAGKMKIKINDKEYDLQTICKAYIKGQTKEQIAESKINLQKAIIECAKLGITDLDIYKCVDNTIQLVNGNTTNMEHTKNR